jgi:hypothetical protein
MDDKQRVYIGSQKIFAGSCAVRGRPGKSAYEVAVEAGYSGTEAEWLASLQGDSAYEVAVEAGYSGTEAEWLDSLRGQDGQDGQPGAKGDKGDKGDPGDTRPRLCAVAVAISATENAHQTLELADVMPSDDLQVGDLLLGTNGYTAWVSGGTDELVYTTSTGQRYNYKPDSDRFDVDLNNMVVDPTSRAITAGSLSKTFTEIQSAYNSGKIIVLNVLSTVSTGVKECIPLSNISSAYVTFEKSVIWNPEDLESGYVSVTVRIASDNTFTGYYREV